MSRRALPVVAVAAVVTLAGCPDAPQPQNPSPPPAKTPAGPAKTPAKTGGETARKTQAAETPLQKTRAQRPPPEPPDDVAAVQRTKRGLRPYATVTLKAPAAVFEGDDVDLTVRLQSLLNWDLPELIPLHGTAGAWAVLVDSDDPRADADRALDDRGHPYTGARFTLQGKGSRTFLRLLFGESAGGWLKPGEYVLRAAYRSTPGELDYKGRDRLDWKTPILSEPVRLRVKPLPKEQVQPAGAARRFLARGVERPLNELVTEARRLLATNLRPALARRVRRHVIRRMLATQRTPAQRRATIARVEAFLASAPSPAEVDRYAVVLGDLHLEGGDEAKARTALRRSTRVRAEFLIASLGE